MIQVVYSAILMAKKLLNRELMSGTQSHKLNLGYTVYLIVRVSYLWPTQNTKHKL